MPISLLPSRRHFLAAAAAGTALFARGLAGAEKKPVDESRFALLADTHIPASEMIESNKTNMARNLRGVVDQLCALESNPSAALVIGDCAHLDGKVGDYKLLGELLAPLGEQGLPVHLCLGNHDHRDHCLDAFPAGDAAAHTAVERRVCILPGKFANWFLLDSLDIVNKAPGLLGENQLKWLVAALDKHADKPALIAVHHNPVGIGGNKTPGLVDAPALLDLAAGRKQVKAVFFGHSHVWQLSQQDGLHLVNLPPVAYVFGAGKPNGWVDCRLSERGATLKLLCHDTQHAEHGKTVELEWRV
jgi:hypothetical protein